MSKETALRFATAFVLVPIVLGGMYLGGYFWAAMVALVVMQTLREYYDLAQAKGLKPPRRPALAVAAAVVLAGVLGLPAASASLVLGFVLLLTLRMARAENTNALADTAVAMSGIVYVAFSLAHGVAMRGLELQGHNQGFALLFLLLGTTFFADTGGYFGGRLFGKHKLVPSISPKKTWEGLVGGIIFAIAMGLGVALVARHVNGYELLPLPWAAALGALNAIMGLVGDLAESMLKRDADVKDSGNLLPGHGGMLDRIDAVLINVPINYYLLVWLLGAQPSS